jgi:hypothetical protein
MSIYVFPHRRFLKIRLYAMYYIHNDADTICDVPPLSKDGES